MWLLNLIKWLKNNSKGVYCRRYWKCLNVVGWWAKSIWQSARQRLLRKVVSLDKSTFWGKQIPSASYILKVRKQLKLLKTYLPIRFEHHIWDDDELSLVKTNLFKYKTVTLTMSCWYVSILFHQKYMHTCEQYQLFKSTSWTRKYCAHLISDPSSCVLAFWDCFK